MWYKGSPKKNKVTPITEDNFKPKEVDFKLRDRVSVISWFCMWHNGEVVDRKHFNTYDEEGHVSGLVYMYVVNLDSLEQVELFQSEIEKI